MMKLETKIYDQDGIHHAEDQIPSDCVIVSAYTPHSCPWDYYGMCWGREYSRVMEAAGIDHAIAADIQTTLHPTGTGPNGSVRFGDNMLPGVYRLIVKKEDEDKARQAIVAHRKAIDNWLDSGAKMPEACRG